jgi:peptidoglycan-associated lipoprotein
MVIAIVSIGCPKKQVVKPYELPEEPIAPEETVAVIPQEPVVKPSIVLERIFFDFDKSDIRQDAAAVLKTNANQLQLFPETKIVIEGHCCELGTSEYNMALGERRANSTRDYLIQLGITTDRMSTVSYGEEKPLDANTLERNRRCEFIEK